MTSAMFNKTDAERTIAEARGWAKWLPDMSVHQPQKIWMNDLCDQLVLALAEVERLEGAKTQYAHEYYDFDGTPQRRKVSEAEFIAHKPDGHRADGSPYWNYTQVRRTVTPWVPSTEQESRDHD